MNQFNNLKYIFSCFIVFFVETNIILAAGPPVTVTNPSGSSSVSELVGKVLEWVLGIAGSIALFMLIIGGTMYITSTGDEQKIATAKKIINWTLIGLVIILTSYSIIAILDNILTS